MLMPDGPYESLIEDLLAGMEPQAGAGKLTPPERDLYRLLRNLKGQLASSARQSAEDWHRLEGVFKVDAADPDNVLVLNQRAHANGQR